MIAVERVSRVYQQAAVSVTAASNDVKKSLDIPCSLALAALTLVVAALL
jgi:hypothetical protein